MSGLTRLTKLSLAAGAATAALAILSPGALAQAHAQQASTNAISIESQDLDDALRALARQTGTQVLFEPNTVAGRRSPEIRAAGSPEQALRQMLAESGLRYRPTGPGAYTILAQASGERPTQLGAAEEPLPSEDEIVVTAQKREERLQDVPAAVSAIGGERLETLQVGSLSDLSSFVPGMSVMGGGSPGYRGLVIRGINSSYENNLTSATVATYVDDLPVDASGAPRVGQFGIDLQPYDIERIEVLKGPQGTLYGSNAMGGIVKYVLRRPDLDDFSVRLGGDSNSIEGSDDLGWSLRTSVNIPVVEDRFGILLSAYSTNTAGYIDNVGTGDENANELTQEGMRASFLWRPLDNLDVRGTVLMQSVDVASMTSVTIDAATLQPAFGRNTVSTNFLEPFNQDTENYTLSVDWDLGGVTLTSASGWSETSQVLNRDLTAPYGSFCGADSLGPGWPGCPDYPQSDALAMWIVSTSVEKFVQEVRLASNSDSNFQWLLGAYYTDETFTAGEAFPTFTPAGVQLPSPDNDIVNYSGGGSFEEIALFANATLSVTDRLDLSAGIRQSQYSREDAPGDISGLFASVRNPTSLPEQDVTVWMTSARYELSEDAMLYARIATGYRPGSGCPSCGVPALGIPGVVDPDETTNYELGYRGSAFDNRFRYDLSIFHIDWTDMQLSLVNENNIGYPGNGGDAASDGAEVALTYIATDNLRLNATIAYTDARLTRVEDAPGASKGDRLPVSPLWTGSISADYTRPLGDSSTTFVAGGAYRFRDDIVNSIGSFGYLAPPIGPQNIVDLYTGLEFQNVSLRLYARNVFDDDSYSGALFVNNPPLPQFVPVQPRTIGVSVDFNF